MTITRNNTALLNRMALLLQPRIGNTARGLFFTVDRLVLKLSNLSS